ncbi:class I SAM-dependent methyltransferase [Pseudomonas yamanorum]|uniref:class I SAM-dependent methyltransferase n=1 Tax=Pseudomonas yamanorum TaxID=515393 RepID=UPI003F74E42C
MSKSDVDVAHNLARQLREPYGTHGVEVAALMHESNSSMTHTCFSCMGILPGDVLLEIGHGNGAHVPQFFETVPHMSYQGLELSWLMHHEAMRFNQASVAIGKARFTVYDGDVFPFSDQTFDKIMTVNTLDFLCDPLRFLSEAHRTLKAGGAFGVAFTSREFMRSLSFISPSLRLYEIEEIRQLISSSGFVNLLEINAHEQSLIGDKYSGHTECKEFFVITASRDDA